MQIGSFIWLARRWWLTVVLATLAGGLAGWLLAGAMVGAYRAESRVLVGPLNAPFETIRASAELTRTYAILATSEEVLEQALANSGIGLEPRRLAGAVEAIPNQDARIVTIQATLADPDQAARAANAIAETLVAVTAAESERPEGQVRVLNTAGAELSRSGPTRVVLAALAALVGLLAAILLAALVEYFDDSLRDVGAVRSVAGARFMGAYPVGGRGRRRPETRAAHVRRYRRLLGDLLARGDRPPRVVLVVAAGSPRDAAEVTSMLAAAGEEVGLPVKVLDAEQALRSRRAAAAGASRLTWLERQAMADAAATEPGGGATTGTAGSVELRAMAELRASLPEGSMGLADGGAAAESFQAALWAPVADAIVVVARVDHDRRVDLDDTIERLAPASDAPIWVVAATPQGDPRFRRLRRRGSQDEPPTPERREPPVDQASALPAGAPETARYGDIDRFPAAPARRGLLEEGE